MRRRSFLASLVGLVLTPFLGKTRPKLRHEPNPVDVLCDLAPVDRARLEPLRRYCAEPVTFDAWLRSQSHAVQNEILGAKLAAKFRQGWKVYSGEEAGLACYRYRRMQRERCVLVAMR